ncbi:MAG: signal peptide peptidase SppA, partial [Chitinophagaceae bacterium]|nr:signal peptide peptidase SppA [Chitinophagaceae bacterium]
AAGDASVKGIYIKAETNNNDFATSDELRNAIIGFKSTGKFVYAYGNSISMKGYYVANIADKVYANPIGGLEWKGMAIQMPFVKGTLDRLEIEPQIFYAGKFKSATEPLREKQMTEANKIQSKEVLFDVYNELLIKTAAARNIDTATLRKYADSNTVQFPHAAVEHKMLDGLKYDDEVKNELREKLKIDADAKINFITPGKYAESVDFQPSGNEKIAVIYAEGNILDGKGDRGQIGGETYMQYIRKARMDKSIKAIVLRINSGGGSAMASELMWREVELAKKVKPVIVSFGDIAASGGYYMACAADSIFAQPTTITGSIGVFNFVMNMQKFFDDKLGITFDNVATNENAIISAVKPMTPFQKKYIQNEVDSIYAGFKLRVAKGRNKSPEFVDSIAQGRIYSGKRAVELGLVDRIGGLNDAIASAAAKANIKSFKLREYPAKQSVIEMFFSKETGDVKEQAIKNELGANGYKLYTLIKEMEQSNGKAQTRIPFELILE